MDDYFAGSVQRTPPTAFQPAPAYPPAYPAYPSAPQQAPWPYAAPAPSDTGRNVLIALLAAFAGLVVLGVVAAVAIPVFLEQRDLSRRTTVSVPDQVAGLPRSTDAMGQAAEARLAGLPGPGDHYAGSFGTADGRVVVGAAVYHMSSKDQAAYLSSAEHEAESRGWQLTTAAPGRLGGRMRCGSSATGTMCVFADGGSYGLVLVTGTVADPEGTARAAREAFVHRT